MLKGQVQEEQPKAEKSPGSKKTLEFLYMGIKIGPALASRCDTYLCCTGLSPSKNTSLLYTDEDMHIWGQGGASVLEGSFFFFPTLSFHTIVGFGRSYQKLHLSLASS